MEMLTNILSHEYLLIVYGIVLWHFMEYVAFKNREQDLKKRKKWKKEQIDDFILSLSFAPLIVIFDDEILKYYNTIFDGTQEVFDKKIYFLSGLCIDRIIYMVMKLKARILSNGKTDI